MQITLTDFNKKIPSLQSNLYKKIGEYETREKALLQALKDKEETEKKVVKLKKAFNFLSTVNKELRTKLVLEIEKLITMAITKILNDDSLLFKLEFEETATNISAKCKLYDKNTQREYSIIDSFGGGLSDIISTALRLISIELWNPKNDMPVFLDECGKFISSEYQKNFSLFLKEWSKQFNRQIILISHIKDVSLESDRNIVITKKGDKAIVSY